MCRVLWLPHYLLRSRLIHVSLNNFDLGFSADKEHKNPFTLLNLNSCSKSNHVLFVVTSSSRLSLFATRSTSHFFVSGCRGHSHKLVSAFTKLSSLALLSIALGDVEDCDGPTPRSKTFWIQRLISQYLTAKDMCRDSSISKVVPHHYFLTHQW